jgi:RNA polymerase sigma-70 factor (ECF subfamily)
MGSGINALLHREHGAQRTLPRPKLAGKKPTTHQPATRNRHPIRLARVPPPAAPPAAPASPSSGPDFRAFVETHKRRLYAVARRLTGNHHDAEDLTQEVFIKAHGALEGFRGDAKVFTWLYRIAVNTYLNTQRKKAVTHMHLADDFSRDASDAPATDEHARREQMRADIEASLDVLAPRERVAFTLKHLHGLKIREVAEAMDVADGTVKATLYRATRKLRDELSQYRDEL